LDVKVKGNGQVECVIEETNGDFVYYPEGGPDGYNDLACQFEDDTASWGVGQGTAQLVGGLTDGSLFIGTDTVIVKILVAGTI